MPKRLSQQDKNYLNMRYSGRPHSHRWEEVIGDLLADPDPPQLFLRADGVFVPVPSAGGNVDGGTPSTNYGGITPVDGGSV